jgi:hypothetical protein
MSLLDTASLIVTPNGYKEGKLYSVIPSDGSGDMSVVRATTATRVNSAGLVELVPYNLLTWSEDFTNGVWVTQNAAITANSTIAPDGTTTADTITEDTANTRKLVYSSPTISANQEYTLSVFVKQNTLQYVRLVLNDLNDNFKWFGAQYNLSNSTYTSAIGSSGSAIFTSASITSVGNGWLRLTITGSINTTSPLFGIFTSDGTAINPSDDRGGVVYLGTGKSSYIWGAQLNEGSLKDYQKTETRLNIPRLDYSNGTCPSLLVEPQRTNLALRSSSFESGFWAKINSTITANTIVSPSGIQDADTLTSTSTIDENQVRFGTFSILGNVGSSYTTSVYAKKGTANYLRIRNLFVNNGGSDGNAWFNLTNGTTGTIQSSQIATIEDAGNGWWRCSLTGVVGSSSSFNFIDIGFADADNDYIPSTIINGYIWGAQLEVGSYVTSYIPTTSASVTRNADKLFKTSATALIGQTEGTIFASFANPAKEAGARYFSLSDGTAGDRIDVYAVSPTEIGIYASKSYGVIVNTSFVVPANLPLKYAVAYKAGQWAWYLNGVQIGTSSNTNIPTLTDIQLTTDPGQGAAAGGNPVNAAALWKTRLTNTQLAELTTL